MRNGVYDKGVTGKDESNPLQQKIAIDLQHDLPTECISINLQYVQII